MQVVELDWSVPAHYQALVPPHFDYVLAADCIYHEHLVRHLYRTMLTITNERTTIIIANERRSESVQSAFTELFSHSFTFKKVPLSKQDPDFSHPIIELYILKRKKGASDENLREIEAAEQAAQQQQQQDEGKQPGTAAAGGPEQQQQQQEVQTPQEQQQEQQQQHELQGAVAALQLQESVASQAGSSTTAAAAEPL